MNKWQIICPLGAMAIFALLAGFGVTRSYERRVFLDRAWNVAHELITTTNSTQLMALDPAFETNLVRFLATPAKVRGVRRESPDSNHPAARRALVFCVNDAAEWMHITLAWDQKAGVYTVVSHSYPAPPPPPVPR